jgi:hypothetical protein
LDEHAGRDQRALGSQLGEDVGHHVVVAADMVKLQTLEVSLELADLCDMGTPGSPLTRLTAVPDKWARPTRRLTDLSVGPTDLVGSPHDLLKTFQKIPQTT